MATRRRAPALLLMLLALAVLAPRGCGEGVYYRLEPGSQLAEGCFGMCLCPVFLRGDLKGFFRLRELPTAGPSASVWYAVEHVVFKVVGVGSPRAEEIATGSGLYKLGTGPDPEHRMELDLVFGDGEPVHFDSGLVPVGDASPPLEIQIDLSRFGLQCYDELLQIRAVPSLSRG